MPKGADAKICKAAQGYEFCNRLFALERQFEKLTAEERLMQRKDFEIDDLLPWSEEMKPWFSAV